MNPYGAPPPGQRQIYWAAGGGRLLSPRWREGGVGGLFRLGVLRGGGGGGGGSGGGEGESKGNNIQDRIDALRARNRMTVKQYLEGGARRGNKSKF